jgi:pseudouridine synthase
MIAAGRVAVDGITVVEPGTKVDPRQVEITVDGVPLPKEGARHYIAVHKPVGYVCTVSDKFAEHKVVDLVSIPGARLVPAGRLDAESEGLVILSNDGEFIQQVTHPSNSTGKTYRVTVRGLPEDNTLRRLANGLVISDGERPTAPATVKVVSRRPTVLEMILREGRNRQIRRMMDTVGHPVIRLIRTRVGPVELGEMPPGAWRELTRAEITGFFPPPRPALRRGGKHPKSQERKGSSPNPPRNEPQASAQGSFGGNQHETDHRRGPRSRSGEDHGKSSAQRVQVHQDRFDRGLPPRGQHHAADRLPGRGHQSVPRPDLRRKQDS